MDQTAPTAEHKGGPTSANGAKYDSQGQVRSEAEHVAPGNK